MGALVGGDDEVAGLVLDGFEGSDVSVEFACVLADEIVTFADLNLRIGFEEHGSYGLHDGW